MTTTTYKRIATEPPVKRWDTPRRNQGQIVTVSYGEPHHAASEHCHGATYQRVFDASDRSVEYYRLASA